jgi:hypothetical protein
VNVVGAEAGGSTGDAGEGLGFVERAERVSGLGWGSHSL